MNKCVKVYQCHAEEWTRYGCDHYQEELILKRIPICRHVDEVSCTNDDHWLCTNPNAIAEAERGSDECQRSDHS